MLNFDLRGQPSWMGIGRLIVVEDKLEHILAKVERLERPIHPYENTNRFFGNYREMKQGTDINSRETYSTDEESFDRANKTVICSGEGPGSIYGSLKKGVKKYSASVESADFAFAFITRTDEALESKEAPLVSMICIHGKGLNRYTAGGVKFLTGCLFSSSD
ncbi:16489_t:CDS:2 [Acaulospora colombiana]|uniref:16489_t:CDS:1 n=1 Tax=Acaulospora colombiana TaxID=27376 RepID=A0ACA9NT87_9GLOM|nr:16489_t:CDS:2 [Acaulospora colombiana]